MHSIKRKLVLPCCYWWWSIDSVYQWMIVMKYDCECKKVWNHSNQNKLHSIGENNCSYLAVTNDGQLNWCKYEWEGWSSKVSKSTIWDDSNRTNITLFEKNNCFYLSFVNNFLLNLCKIMRVMKFEGEHIENL